MVTEEWQYSGLKYENCLHNIGSGWTGICRMCTEMVEDWSMQSVYKRVIVVVEWIGLEYADSLQKTGSGSGVDWSLQTVYRRLVLVVEWSIQNINEADLGGRRRIWAVGRALKVSCLSSFEVVVQANVISIPDLFTFKVYRSITIILI
jgi:hypothetical protein